MERRDGSFNAEDAESAENAERKARLDGLTEAIIAAAIEVHRSLGPGLLESAYEACLLYELAQRGLRVEQQKALPVSYKGVKLDCAYRLDLVVEELVIVEIKTVEQLLPIHHAQLLSYLRLSGCVVGLLINFNTRVLREGIKRVVNAYPEVPSASPASSAASALKEPIPPVPPGRMP